MDPSRGKRIYNEKLEEGIFMEDEEDDEEDDVGFSYGDHQDDRKKRAVNQLSSRKGSSGGGLTPPLCQVESCTADMTSAKPYHKRHKVCEFHAKAPVVLLAGLQQRFCQQCSRFHVLPEFDEAKRSCRRRLAGHNERRRKSSYEYHGEGSG